MLASVRESLLGERDRLAARIAAERALSIVNQEMVATLEHDLRNIQNALNDTSGVSSFLAARRSKSR